MVFSVMPTILQIGPYRFFFYSNEQGEPKHIHVQQDQKLAKFWLKPVRLASNNGFASHDLNRLQRLVVKHEKLFVEAWNEFFSN